MLFYFWSCHVSCGVVHGRELFFEKYNGLGVYRGSRERQHVFLWHEKSKVATNTDFETSCGVVGYSVQDVEEENRHVSFVWAACTVCAVDLRNDALRAHWAESSIATSVPCAAQSHSSVWLKTNHVWRRTRETIGSEMFPFMCAMESFRSHESHYTNIDTLRINVRIATNVAETCTIFLLVPVMTLIINLMISAAPNHDGALCEEGFGHRQGRRHHPAQPSR